MTFYIIILNVYEEERNTITHMPRYSLIYHTLLFFILLYLLAMIDIIYIHLFLVVHTVVSFSKVVGHLSNDPQQTKWTKQAWD